jgi:hypothetical protein
MDWYRMAYPEKFAGENARKWTLSKLSLLLFLYLN